MNQSFPDAKPKAWLLLAYGDSLTYGGHGGYDDIVHEKYQYDNFVPNHKQVSEGDIAVVRDQTELLGLAKILFIDKQASTKKRKRCPICKTTNIDKRTTKKPTFRCAKGHEFSKEIRSEEPCFRYSAYFGDTFLDARGLLDRHQLSQACPKFNQQLAMQEIQLDTILPVIEAQLNIRSLLIDPEAKKIVKPSESNEQDIERRDFAKEVNRQIRERRGQRKFRANLRQIYQDRCVVTSCTIVDILEAAHITPYSVDFNNASSNGLLLRSDIHTLFDLNLLGIEPESLTVCFHPDIKDDEYKRYEGITLSELAQHANPNLLRLKWNEFKSAVDRVN